MIIGFSDEYEAFIDAQYPKNISKKIRFKESELMDIYTLHKMERVEPSFIQTTIKDQAIASFYTGSNYQQFVGLPDYTVTIILTDEDLMEDILPKDFEGLIRRIAHLVLPHSENNPDYHEMVKNFFMMLQNGDLEPYWEEYDESYLDNIPEVLPKEEKDVSEEDISEGIVNGEISEEVELSEEELIEEELTEEELTEGDLTEEELGDKEMLEKMLFETSPLSEEDRDVISIEEEVTEEEPIEVIIPKELGLIEETIEESTEEQAIEEEILDEISEEREAEEEGAEAEEEVPETKEEEEVIQKLEESVSEEHYKKLEFEVLEGEIEDLKAELKEKTEKIKELTKRMTELKSERVEIEKFIDGKATIEENVNRLTDLSIKQGEDIEKHAGKINDLMKVIDEKERTIDDLNKEIETHIDSITTLKIELRDFKSKRKKEDYSRKDELIDMKKELKVLRRERDRYMKIIKDNDLL
jgi:hypothetical protein